MIKINDKVLNNQEVIDLLIAEGGKGKIDHDIEFCLLENHQSQIQTINDLDEKKWVKKYPATFGLTNTYERRNFKTGGTETITYYTQVLTDPKFGNRYHTKNLNKLDFINGYFTVKIGEEDLLLFLRLSEQCKTNKCWGETDARGNQKYMPVKSFLYKEIIHEVEDEQQFQEIYEGLTAQAVAMSRDKLPYATAITMAQGYGMSDAQHKGEKAVRLFLHNKARVNPDQFMKDLSDTSFELRAKINTAFQYGIVKWDSPYIRWGGKVEGDNRIVSVPNNRDHVDYFTLWLNEIDKSGLKNVILSKVEEKTLQGYGIKLPEKENQFNSVLESLGVSSLEEAQALISKGKGGIPVKPLKPLLANVDDIMNNIHKLSKQELLEYDLETLKTIASRLGLRGSHLYKFEDKAVENIMRARSVPA